ncbi:MerR family transcriptional regulator [Floridanema evergladense]|uniref:MerR family transcriptional regulator n=1 Tax=Floridaenema evergladense BLCC-F167 TaxID=3153639 RepID=A0ABV4WSF3_9CYAN
MITLQQLAQGNYSWSLDELVQIVNVLLPQYLPEERSHTRVREEITPRLVRHYTTLGMLDEPLKEGRYAVYTYRHLLQILVVRRLLAEGYGASAIDNFAKSKDNTELEALLQGGVQLTLTTANPALAFLEQIQNRQSLPKITPIPTSSTSAIVKPSASSRWARLEVIPGLEIHLREDFVYPSSPQEQQNLLQQIRQILIAFVTKGRSSK